MLFPSRLSLVINQSACLPALALACTLTMGKNAKSLCTQQILPCLEQRGGVRITIAYTAEILKIRLLRRYFFINKKYPSNLGFKEYKKKKKQKKKKKGHKKKKNKIFIFFVTGRKAKKINIK